MLAPRGQGRLQWLLTKHRRRAYAAFGQTEQWHYRRRDLEAASEILPADYAWHVFSAAVQHGGRHRGRQLRGQGSAGRGGRLRVADSEPDHRLFCGRIVGRDGHRVAGLRREGRAERVALRAHGDAAGAGRRRDHDGDRSSDFAHAAGVDENAAGYDGTVARLCGHRVHGDDSGHGVQRRLGGFARRGRFPAAAVFPDCRVPDQHRARRSVCGRPSG